MSRFDRINTAITELPPESAFYVFSFIADIFDRNLDKEVFKEHFWDFDVAQQHYICYYLEIYFDSSDRYTFFNKWMEEKRLEYVDIGKEEGILAPYKFGVI